jgi:zinc transport system substrate-binding protein
MNRTARAAILLVLLTTLVGCSGGSGSSPASGAGAAPGAERMKVVADVYPVGYAAQQVGGDAVDLTILTPPGVEPHDLELSASQVKQIAAADVILYVPGMVPALATAIQQQAPDRAFDVTAGIDRTGLAADAAADPHVWLDPANMIPVGKAAAAAMDAARPGTASHAGDFEAAMAKLSRDYASGLANCRIKPLVVSHEAFGWLARAYGFDQHGISGLSPEAEPSPARMREISELVRDNGVTTIYYETLVSDKAAKAISEETGATAVLLDPVEGATGGLDYPQIMEANLATLITGQACG